MRFNFFLSVFCFFFVDLHQEVEARNKDSRRGQTFDAVRYIEKNGYVPKVYSVATDDGFHIIIYRITRKKSKYESRRELKRKVPVFLQHGFLTSSDFFLLNGREYGLPFLLVDEGFDVWMGNVKGNKYGTLSGTQYLLDHSYWNFTWHDLAMNDLAMQLDFVHEHCGGQKVNFVGHSMGSTMFLALLAQKPEYNEIIDRSFLMSPMAYMTNIKSAMFVFLRNYFEDYTNLQNILGHGEFLPNSRRFLSVIQQYCMIGYRKCKIPEYLLTGKDPVEYNQLAQEVIANQMSGGSSVKTFIHIGQLYNSGYFRQFDYGREGNMEAYGMTSPPDYNLQNIKVPMYFFLGDDDQLSIESDVNKLVKELPGSVDVYNVKTPNFYHMDFLLSRDAKKEVYNNIIDELKSSRRHWINSK